MGVAILVKPIKDRRKMGAFPTSGADALNVLKGPMDAWNGVLYIDDRQVVRFHRLEKIWAPAGFEPGLYIELMEITG
jgi:Holliday junction resolvase RusA-like endonuclease